MSLGGEELDLDATWAAYAVTDGATVTVEVPLQHTAQAQAAGPYQAGPIRMNCGVIFDVVPNEPSKASVVLENTSDDCAVFKIMTTNPSRFFIRPNQGLLMPHTKKMVNFVMTKQDESPTRQSKDKYLLNASTYLSHAYNGDATEDTFTWTALDQSVHDIHKCKVPVQFAEDCIAV